MTFPPHRLWSKGNLLCPSRRRTELSMFQINDPIRRKTTAEAVSSLQAVHQVRRGARTIFGPCTILFTCFPSAAFSHGIAVPIDVIKTKSQTDDALEGLSPLDAALKIVEDESAVALSKGLQPTVLGYVFEGAVKFGVYESLKPLFLGQFLDQPNEAYLAAAVCAGALASVILCPLEETRIRLVTDSSFASGLTDGLPKLLRENGIASPFRKGLAPMLSKQVPYTIGKQVSFDLFASVLYSFLSGLSFVPRGQIAIEVEIGAAFLASIVACLLSQPGDVILTQTYKNGSSSAGFLSTINSLYADGGVGRFFRGLSARFLHVGCIITFQLVIYDQLKQALGLPASGS